MNSILDFRRVPSVRMKQVSDAFKQMESDMYALGEQIWRATEWQRQMVLDAIAPIQNMLANVRDDYNKEPFRDSGDSSSIRVRNEHKGNSKKALFLSKHST